MPPKFVRLENDTASLDGDLALREVSDGAKPEAPATVTSLTRFEVRLFTF